MSLTRSLVFLLVLGVVAGLGHYYLWARLVRDPVWSPRLRRLGTRLAWAVPPLLVLSLAFGTRGPRAVGVWLGRPAYVWLGLFFYLLILLAVGDLARLLGWLRRRLGDGSVQSPERRRFFARATALVATAGATGTVGAGMASALGTVETRRVDVRLPKLGGRKRYTIVQLTDVHIGPTLGKTWLRDIVDSVNALQPDVVAITGDLVDGSVAELAEHVAPLADLRAREGVFFVTGNHEYYSGADAWITHLESLGVRVLRNERVALEGFDLAGVDDATAHGAGHGADYAKAMQGRDAARAVVMLAHQPKAILQAHTHGVDLMLSGHTHGGQLFPWNFLVPLQQPYVAGLHRHENSWIYVSRGTGFWGPPVRVAAPAEITEVVLQA